MADLVSRIVPVLILALGVSYFLQPRQWLQLSQEIMAAPYRFLTPSLVMLASGMAVVLTHNVWKLEWEVATTVFGWILIVKGGLFLLFPQVVRSFSELPDRLLLTWVRVAGVVLAVAGAFATERAWNGA